MTNGNKSHSKISEYGLQKGKRPPAGTGAGINFFNFLKVNNI
jgi:hypothetical protein